MEEELKQLMGESYHEGMTAAEVQEYFNKALLATGNYVNKSMAEAEQNKLRQQITEKDNALQAKMTNEEKEALAKAEKDRQIQELKELLAKNALSSNKYKAFGLTAEARINANVKEDDTEFSEFINNIVSEDETKTTKISSYVNKLVKAAYEKGKADMTKDKMAKMGDFKKNENNDGNEEKGSIGKRLAKSNLNNFKNPYFKI